MKKQTPVLLIGVAVIAAIFAMILSSLIFGSPKKNPSKVPQVAPIQSTFPVVKNDDTYKTIFNDKALDPTQLIRIGDQSNNQPFRSQ